MKSKARRSLAKTLTWRVLATTDTFIILVYYWYMDLAEPIAGIEVVTKMFLYYGHERLWNRITWVKEKTTHTTIWSYQ